MLTVYRNNRMELLLSELSSVLSEKRPNPLQPEVVVVQSLGMERWISMGQALRFGVWANAEHPFPRAFIERVFDAVVGEVDPAQSWSRESVTLHIAAILDELPALSSLQRLKRCLDDLTDVESRLELAAEIADAFDQTQIYRPEWFLDWSSRSNEEASDDFRPTLFRLLESRLGKHHFPARFAEFERKLDSVDWQAKDLPSRISLFAVAALPPAFLRVFDRLSSKAHVHWFMLTASREYLGEEIGRQDFRGVEAFGGDCSQPLLTSYGRMMRDVARLVERDCHYQEGGAEAFAEPPCGLVLPTLQADLCALRRRGATPDVPKLPLGDTDRSLTVHVCHGPRREIEVLREVLVDAFEKDASLVPEDVIVLLRDVELYAPLVEAVFSTDRGKPSHIPFTLADRAIGVGNDLAKAFDRLLGLSVRRITVTDLGLLLSHSAVAARFDIEPNDVPRIRQWLGKLGMRWGADSQDRLRQGLPAAAEHTLRFGLRRLVLGAAMDSANKEPFASMVPFDVEGDEAKLAGRFVEYAELVLQFAEELTHPRTIQDYCSKLSEMVCALFLPTDEDAWQLSELLSAIDGIATEAERANYQAKVPARYLAKRIAECFEETRSARAFLSSGVTFCAMLPMRGVPAKIVALVGLDDGCFPRTSRTSSFDEIAREPRLGDRLLREEDRHLFLESLLAARERLILTYVGRSARDDSERPPSVVIEELLRVVDESFYLPDATNSGSSTTQMSSRRPSDALVILHPMHAHSPRYFDGSDPRLSQSRLSAYHAALALRSGSSTKQSKKHERLRPLARSELSTLDLERFWCGPAEAFFKMRLMAQIEKERDEPEVLDPVELNSLERFQLMTEQFAALGAGAPLEQLRRRFVASGRSPVGALGELEFDDCLEQVTRMRRVFDRLTQGRRARALRIALPLEGTELVGSVGDWYVERRVDCRLSRSSEKHLMVAWLRHLFLCSSGVSVTSDVLRFSATTRVEPTIERFSALEPSLAQRHLLGLFRLFEVGMTAPLAFFPTLSYEYAKRVRASESKDSAIARAVRDYGDPLSELESEFARPAVVAEIARMFGEPPIDDGFPERQGWTGVPSFSELALAVWGPCLDAKAEVDEEETRYLLSDDAVRETGKAATQ